MNYEQATGILERLEFRDWRFHLDWNPRQPWLQVQFVAPDADDGTPTLQKGRKWMLSAYMTPSEIVTTALKAVLAAVEHEAREDFLYAGRRLFGPHIDIDALCEVADRTDSRTPIPTQITK